MSKQNPRAQIYGIVGTKGHGKDTFAQLVKRYNPGFTILHFADDLKSMCAAVFGLSEAQMHDPLQKEVSLTVEINMDLYLRQMGLITGLDIAPQGKTAQTPREIMQFFGSEYVRSVQDDYWIQRVLQKIARIKRRILIPDTRFPNESEALRSVGAKIIRIVRMDAGTSSVGSTHQSETEMNKIAADCVYHVKTGDLSIVKRAAQLLAMNKMEPAFRYSYPTIQKAAASYQSGKTIEEVAKEIGITASNYGPLKLCFEYYGVPISGKARTVKHP